MRRQIIIAFVAAALSAGFMGASVALAQDDVLRSARASGVIGEQADGFLGIRPGQTASADLRARVEQNNIMRRAEYTNRARQNNATPNEMAASTVCLLFGERARVGHWYRDEGGTWRQHTAASPVPLPSWCRAGAN